MGRGFEPLPGHSLNTKSPAKYTCRGFLFFRIFRIKHFVPYKLNDILPAKTIPALYLLYITDMNNNNKYGDKTF